VLCCTPLPPLVGVPLPPLGSSDWALLHWLLKADRVSLCADVWLGEVGLRGGWPREWMPFCADVWFREDGLRGGWPKERIPFCADVWFKEDGLRGGWPGELEGATEVERGRSEDRLPYPFAEAEGIIFVWCRSLPLHSTTVVEGGE